MGFPRQEYWSGLPFPSPGDLPDPGIEPTSPAMPGKFFTTEPPGKPGGYRFRLRTQGLCHCPPPAPDLLAGWFCRVLCGALPFPSSYVHTVIGLMSHLWEHRPHPQSSGVEYFGDAFFYIDFSLLDWAPEKQKPWLIHLCLSSEALFHTLLTWWPWHIPSSLWSSVSSSVKVGGDGSTLAGWLLLLSRFSRVRLCATPEMTAHQAPPSLGFSRQEHWSGVPLPSPMHESEKWKWSRSVVPDS